MQVLVLTSDELKQIVADAAAQASTETVKKMKVVPDVLTIQELADYWRVSEGTIRNLMKRSVHPLPSRRIGDARFYRAEVDEWSLLEAARLAKEKQAA